MKTKKLKGQPLDLLEASYLRCQNPIIYCDISFDSKINIERLKIAVLHTIKSIPEIICVYNLKKIVGMI